MGRTVVPGVTTAVVEQRWRLDEAEFERLFREYWPRAMGVALRDAKGNRALAEDFAAEAFEAVWELTALKGAVLVDEDHFKALLFKQIHWQRGAWISRMRNSQEEAMAAVPDDVLHDASAEQVVLDWLGGDAVAALAHVNPPGRVILVRKIVQGWTVAEIAAEYGYGSDSAAAHALQRARDELRRAYGEVAGVPTPVPFVARLSATCCARGHQKIDENGYRNSAGKWVCRLCRRERERDRPAGPPRVRDQDAYREGQRERSRKSYLRRKQREAELTCRLDEVDLAVAGVLRDA